MIIPVEEDRVKKIIIEGETGMSLVIQNFPPELDDTDLEKLYTGAPMASTGFTILLLLAYGAACSLGVCI